jgi:vanillate/3-O-methylgallate O-demethylase
MTGKNLEQLLAESASPVELLRNSQIGPYAFPVVRHEFTNWRDEQRAWRDSCALFDQSHHMSDLYVRGPDTLKLLTRLGINTFKNFAVNKAKQFVACNHDGYVIGDAILFYLDQDSVSLVGRPPAINWTQFHAETGGYRVTVERDERSAVNAGRRLVYRYQVQGPKALAVMQKVTGSPVPDIRFFNMDVLEIAGRQVRALRHGMVGMPGFELFGPWTDAEAVKQAIVAAGQEFGIRQVGARTYPTSTLESGWIPSPLPAIYTGSAMQPYRKWLPANAYEGMASLGGSFESTQIEDYYLTPFDLGYGPFVKFDHDFIGRDALEKMAAAPPRTKVTLAWNGADVTAAIGTLFGPESDAKKYIDWPLANYATLPFDRIMADGKQVGLSTYTGYSHNERTVLSLSIIDNAYARPGTEVTVVWGESNGGSIKPTVEPHRQVEFRAKVGPVPYADLARTAYRPD